LLSKRKNPIQIITNKEATMLAFASEAGFLNNAVGDIEEFSKVFDIDVSLDMDFDKKILEEVERNITIGEGAIIDLSKDIIEYTPYKVSAYDNVTAKHSWAGYTYSYTRGAGGTYEWNRVPNKPKTIIPETTEEEVSEYVLDGFIFDNDMQAWIPAHMQDERFDDIEETAAQETMDWINNSI
jgi:hypothetical protein